MDLEADWQWRPTNHLLRVENPESLPIVIAEAGLCGACRCVGVCACVCSVASSLARANNSRGNSGCHSSPLCDRA